MANRDEWLLINEVAQIARVSPETVRFWIKTRRLPSVRPGRRRLIRRDALEAFLVSGGSKPARSEGK
jgi:excisionase family DNA binding protein